MGKAAKKIAIGAAIAGGLGYLAGILTAPKSGRETRAEVKEAASKGLGEAEKDLKQLYAELSKLVDSAKEKSSQLSDRTQKDLTVLLEKAKDSKEKLREMLSAVHEGDAQDKDLQRAIADATKAIEHIKDFLSK